jgi:hypothetical protein
MSVERPDLVGRCGTCARFVRVTETVDESGEVKRHGECLLGVWPSPLWETSTCSQYVMKGTFKPAAQRPERTRSTGRTPRAGLPGRTQTSTSPSPVERAPLTLPEDLLEMDANEFRDVLREVIRDELGMFAVELGGRWEGGEIVIKPGKEGTQEKRIPVEAFFHKIVMVRDKLRVLEQKVNSSKLSDEEKVQIQQYITQCYGSLTTFNVLFANRGDAFVGQKGDRDE